MLRFTGTRLRTAASAGARSNGLAFQSRKRSLVFSKPFRFYGTNAPDVDPVSLQMIKYALDHARSQKSDESYAQGLLVLEQCLSGNLREGTDTSRGMVLLAMSSLLSERGKIDEAIEKLETIQDLSRSSLALRGWLASSLLLYFILIFKICCRHRIRIYRHWVRFLGLVASVELSAICIQKRNGKSYSS
ncbi:uncharacterized protein LOC122661489 [Telopea speciosissima]|uniref:uncharacterized protein LOC122661489 n=1 Tax=Telopea speciosissima TaxID=54955 RepID=UPI001CC7214D|nr:uncharacterized protein LOC122661489 [Telopea speciosissima]